MEEFHEDIKMSPSAQILAGIFDEMPTQGE